ncbi:MAG: cupin domain-containing protein [Dehalococcoidia bacterium]|nr:cupin domain-containing protein [Dehalococcoidia bacterium]
MSQEEVVVEGNPTYIIALGENLEERLERANYSYTSARRPPLPRARPFLIGHATLTPLFDRVLGKNHIIKGRYEPGTVSALHTHDADQYLIITGGSGEVRDRTNSYELKPGMVVWIPAETAHVHAATTDEPLEFIFITTTGHSSDICD